jgi:flavin-dependent dehydrogenase
VQYFDRSIAYQVRRDQFDLALLDEAISSGARVWTGTTLGRITRMGTHFIVRVGGRTLKTGSIIAADGATSKVLRELVPQSRTGGNERVFYRPWTSAEGWASLKHPIDSRLVAIDLGSIKGGYAWSFPKKDSLWGLGVAGFLTPLTDPKSELRKYLSRSHAELGSEGALTWPLPNYRAARHGYIPGLFLVGDAGGIVDPFLGEGIYYAVLSGTKAAEAYLASRSWSADPSGSRENASKSYCRWLDSSIWPDFRQGSRLAQAIYRFPGVFFKLTGRYPGLLDLYASILTGEHDYRSFSKEIIGRALRRILPGQRSFDGRAL